MIPILRLNRFPSGCTLNMRLDAVPPIPVKEVDMCHDTPLQRDDLHLR
jgi:hypothetical protein